MSNEQQQQQRSTSKRKKTYFSLKEWYANASGIMLDKLCVCGASPDQVLLDDANSESWSMCASTPLAFNGHQNGNDNGDEPSICRIDTMPMKNTKASIDTRRSTSRAAVATRAGARRPVRSPVRVMGTGSSYFDDEDEDVHDHERLDETVREYIMSPSFSQYQYQDQDEENSMIRDAPCVREHFMSPSFSQYQRHQDLSSSSRSSRSRLSSLDKQQQPGEDARDSLFVLSSSSSSFQKPSNNNKDKGRTMKYPDGPQPISPTNTFATVSLSQSMSQDDYDEHDYDYEQEEEQLELGSAVSTQVVSHCFRPKRQKIVFPSSNDENNDNDNNGVDHEAYGFLLRMKPQNYLREDQQGIDYAGGVMFQSPMRMMMLDDADDDSYSYSIPPPSMPELK